MKCAMTIGNSNMPIPDTGNDMYLHNDAGGNDVLNIGAVSTSDVFSLPFIPLDTVQVIERNSLSYDTMIQIILPLFQ